MFQRRSSILVRTVSILGATLLVATARPAAADGEQFRIETGHYSVRTDISGEFTRQIARHMEAIHKEYVRRFESYRLKEHQRFEVRVFARREDYEAQAPPQLKGSTGAFLSRERLLVAFREGRTDERVFRTLYHEGFHQFLYTCVAKDVPLWLNEGFAEYFSEAVWNGTSFSTGQVPTQRLRVLKDALKKGNHVRLSRLFTLDSGEWLAEVRGGSEQAYLQYCQAWSVVHFLLHSHGGRYRRRILGYVRLISEGVGPEEGFRRSFGSDVEAFEQAWGGYVMELKATPGEVCRHNLRLLAFLALHLYPEPGRLKSLRQLRHDLLETGEVQWELRTPGGEQIRSSERQRVASLFRCPFHGGGAGISYVLLRGPHTGHSEIYCTHHRGIILKAYYAPGEDGQLEVRVERLVRDLVPEGLARRLRARLQ